MPQCTQFIEAGAALSDEKICDLRDNSGDNISTKNATYCELTALYWIWKNENLPQYVGLNFYSRIFDFKETELFYILSSKVDVIVPEPVIVPAIMESKKAGIDNNDFIGDFLEKSIAKVSPSYLETYKIILKEGILAPSNIFITRKDIFHRYCSWLFAVIDCYENLLFQSSVTVPPRHIGYIAEILQSVFFIKNSSDLNILFARRRYLG